MIINWNEISWVFSYKFVRESLPTLQIVKDIEGAGYVGSKGEIAFEGQENNIEIPKISVSAPIVFTREQNQKAYQSALQKGVLHYPQSALPGLGTSIILGHSAPPNWPKVNYDWVFNDLDKLEPGDKIFVNFDNKKYVYLVKDKIFLEKGEGLPESLTSSENMLVLISCWPPGKDIMRVVVAAVNSTYED